MVYFKVVFLFLCGGVSLSVISCDACTVTFTNRSGSV